ERPSSPSQAAPSGSGASGSSASSVLSCAPAGAGAERTASNATVASPRIRRQAIEATSARRNMPPCLGRTGRHRNPSPRRRPDASRARVAETVARMAAAALVAPTELSRDVRAEYERRAGERRARAAGAAAAAARTSNARLVVFGLGLAWAWGVFGDGRLPGWSLLVPLVGFVALVVRHDGLLRRAQ